MHAIDFEKPAVHFENGVYQEFDAILGADGLRSTCRALFLGHRTFVQPSGKTAYRVIVPFDLVKRDRKLLELLENASISFWLGPRGHAVCYQLAGLLNLILIRPCEDGQSGEVSEINDDDEKELLFNNWDPRLRDIFRLATRVLKTPLQNILDVDRWTHKDGKFALVGDACHASLPHL